MWRTSQNKVRAGEGVPLVSGFSGWSYFSGGEFATKLSDCDLLLLIGFFLSCSCFSKSKCMDSITQLFAHFDGVCEYKVRFQNLPCGVQFQIGGTLLLVSETEI